MTLHRSITGLATVALLVASAAAQTPAKKPSPWDPLRFFVGSWTGVERFEMAEPIGEFAVYSESRFRRKK